MEQEGSLLGKARRRITLAKNLDIAYSSAQEVSFQTDVKPELERIKSKLFEQHGPPNIFGELATEIQEFVLEREGYNAHIEESDHFYFVPDDSSQDSFEFVTSNLENPNISELCSKRRKMLVGLWEKGGLEERAGIKRAIFITKDIGCINLNCIYLTFMYLKGKGSISCGLTGPNYENGCCSTEDLSEGGLNRFVDNLLIELETVLPPKHW